MKYKSNLLSVNRIIITPTALQLERTNLIIERARQLNPDLKIIYSTNQIPKLPTGLSAEQKQKYLNETLLLCTRSKGAPFIEIFASPGHINENIGTMGKIVSHCPFGCEFCYLQVAGRGTPWTRVYVDLERFREEAKKEEYAQKMYLTLWSAISFYKEETFQKVPQGFKNICDNEIRKAVLSERNGINSHKIALEYLKSNLKKYFVELGIEIDETKYSKVINNLTAYYNKNKNIPLWVNVSEYSDVLGLDHITGTLDEILSWMEEDKNLRVNLRTKSPDVSSILKYKTLDRLIIQVDLNTNYSINHFQKNTFSLKDRIKAINLLIAAGVNVRIVIEPIIKYKNFMKDYKNLISIIEKKIDLSKVERFTIGCVRYKTRLMNHIKKVNPKTVLFNEDQKLIPPEKGDKRWRYSTEDRVNIYKAIINCLPQKHRKLIRLGAEDPSVWELLNLDRSIVHDGAVHQYKNKRTSK